MTIHSTDPFAVPEPERSPARRLRGRFSATVTLWTAPGPAGLTVSSTLVADGDPGLLLGLLDDESELWPALQRSEVCAVTLLQAGEQQLADQFAGLMPVPGGLFRRHDWRDTEFGPVLSGARTWAGCRLLDAAPCGWGLLVRVELVSIVLDDPGPTLLHHRGRYRSSSG